MDHMRGRVLGGIVGLALQLGCTHRTAAVVATAAIPISAVGALATTTCFGEHHEVGGELVTCPTGIGLLIVGGAMLTIAVISAARDDPAPPRQEVEAAERRNRVQRAIEETHRRGELTPAEQAVVDQRAREAEDRRKEVVHDL